MTLAPMIFVFITTISKGWNYDIFSLQQYNPKNATDFGVVRPPWAFILTCSLPFKLNEQKCLFKLLTKLLFVVSVVNLSTWLRLCQCIQMRILCVFVQSVSSLSLQFQNFKKVLFCEIFTFVLFCITGKYLKLFFDVAFHLHVCGPGWKPWIWT